MKQAMKETHAYLRLIKQTHTHTYSLQCDSLSELNSIRKRIHPDKHAENKTFRQNERVKECVLNSNIKKVN